MQSERESNSPNIRKSSQEQAGAIRKGLNPLPSLRLTLILGFNTQQRSVVSFLEVYVNKNVAVDTWLLGAGGGREGSASVNNLPQLSASSVSRGTAALSGTVNKRPNRARNGRRFGRHRCVPLLPSWMCVGETKSGDPPKIRTAKPCSLEI